MKLKLIFTTVPSLVGNETRSVDTVQLSFRSPAMAFYNARSSLRGFPRNGSNASLITKDYSGRSRAHLTVSPEQGFVPNKRGRHCENQFHLSLWASI